MTPRLSLLAAVLVTVLLLPASASAAARAALVSPGRDAVVSSPAELRVQVTRDVLDPDVTQVEVRLSKDGATIAPGTRTVGLTCASGCGTPESVWGGRSYDPASTAPFGGGPGCNGRWYLQVAVDGGAFGSATPVRASAPGSPARDVRVAIDGRDAVLTWGRAPEPDIAGYRVERRAEGGSWSPVGEAPADASRLVDADVDQGTYEWRVVTLRGDGRGDGGAAAPCADREPDLSTVSPSTRGRVTAPPPPPPSPSPSADPDAGDPSDDGGAPSAGGDADGGTGNGGGAIGGTGGEAPAPDAGSPPTSDAEAPTAEAAAVPTEEEVRYYGEDQPIGALDYGTATSDAAAAGPGGGTMVPGGVSISTARDLDRLRLLRPVTGGMILLTFAFHIRRWQREHDV